MKKNLLLFSPLIIAVFTSNAQITVTQADMPIIGTVLYEGTDTVITANPGGTGNQTWNFATLQPHKKDTTTLLDPTGQPGTNYFPGAEIALENQTQGLISGYVYLNLSSTELSQMGVYGDFGFGMMPLIMQPPLKIASFPSTYQTQFSGVSKYGIQVAYPQPPVDSIRSITTHSYSCIIDAYGSLTTPTGTYSALRQYNIASQIDSLFTHNSLNNMWTFAQSDTTPDTNYRFLANNMFSPLEIDKDGQAKYQISSGTVLSPEISSSGIFLFVYPNPSTGVLNFEGNFASGSTIEIFDISGKLTEVVRVMNSKVSIDTKCYAEGLYLYRIISADQKLVSDGKFSVVK